MRRVSVTVSFTSRTFLYGAGPFTVTHLTLPTNSEVYIWEVDVPGTELTRKQQ